MALQILLVAAGSLSYYNPPSTFDPGSHQPIEAPPPAPPSFRFAKAVSDGMVLQSAPNEAMVWGFCSENTSSVTVTFQNRSIAATVGPDQAQGTMTTWRALLPPISAGFTEHSLSVTDGNSTLTLQGILFGDVWICSGQSNMEYPIGNATCWDSNNTDCHDKTAKQCNFGCSNHSGD
jgi:hypothetical protein